MPELVEPLMNMLGNTPLAPGLIGAVRDVAFSLEVAMRDAFRRSEQV